MSEDFYIGSAVFGGIILFFGCLLIFVSAADIREKACIVELVGQDVPATEAKLVCRRR